MKKITVRAVSVIIALLLVITSVSAAAFEAPISTYRYATCTAEMSLYENISAEMTITLYKSKNKTSWTPVQTWDVDRSILPSFEGGCRVSSGYYYMAELSANTYNRYGSFVEDVSLTSAIRQY